MENFFEYRFSKVAARMKPGVVPHIFSCQPERTEPQPNNEKIVKRQFSDILTESEMLVPKNISILQISQPSTSCQPEILEKLSASKFDFECQAYPANHCIKATQVAS